MLEPRKWNSKILIGKHKNTSGILGSLERAGCGCLWCVTCVLPFIWLLSFLYLFSVEWTVHVFYPKKKKHSLWAVSIIPHKTEVLNLINEKSLLVKCMVIYVSHYSLVIWVSIGSTGKSSDNGIRVNDLITNFLRIIMTWPWLFFHP